MLHLKMRNDLTKCVIIDMVNFSVRRHLFRNFGVSSDRTL